MAVGLLMVLYLLGVPLLVMWLATRWRWVDKVSPMTLLYIIGLAVGNSGLFSTATTATQVNSWVGNVAVPLSIPLMLMSCDIRRWSTRKALKSAIIGFVAVVAVTIGGYFLFRGMADALLTHKDYAQVCAVATGIYTGGIPNMGAIKQGVGMRQELYLCITGYDLVVTGIYLMFIVFFGKKVFRRLLPNIREDSHTETAPSSSTSMEEASTPTATKGFFSLCRSTWQVAGLAVGIVVVAYLLARWCGRGEVSTMWLILFLTTLSVVASFLPFVRRQEGSFSLGLYCVYVFCLSVATACDVRSIDFYGHLPLLGYLFFVVFGSVVLQIVLSRWVGIDGDSVMVTSVALINSPPFVPMVAALLHNKDVALTGIAVGLLGYVCGNYLGIGLFRLLMSFG